MLITVEATYEGGVLKLRQPLPLDEHQTVQVTVEIGNASSIDPPNDSSEIEPIAPASASRLSRIADEPTIPAEWEMVDIVLNIPRSPTATTVKARLGRLPMPDPPMIPGDDFE